ncbi:MAG: hypothetical protein N2Z40_03545 [Caldimicrobium sp.]|nr:hypothetical protein [Caldimicrobium sp.]MCX7613283.1 hypothetical protein [Caldimicrobium sp.]MDW8182398.1 hypothetical protein [Caldimicrobium sp.]
MKKQKPFPLEISQEEKDLLFSYLEERFGITRDIFYPYTFLKGVNNYWLFPKSSHLEKLKNLNPEVVGLLFLRKVSKYLKPTSAFLQRFGYHATKNIVTIDKKAIDLFQKGRPLEVELPIEPGYVILRDKYWILGCGLYLNGKLYSHLKTRLTNVLEGI